MKLKFLFFTIAISFLIFAFAKPVVNSIEILDAPIDYRIRNESGEEEVQKIVETFFKGFHAQDSILIKSVVHEKVLMQSIGKNNTGEVVLSKQDFNGFLTSICSIPESTSFEERIDSYKVRMDGKMANVWTPYSFYINGALSHCGTNSFQLFKRDGVWKIFYIVDTRDREGCGLKRG